MLNFFDKYKYFFVIFFLTLLIFIIKWSISYWLYQEGGLTKVIFESKLTGDGAHYFPSIKFLSENNFSNSFNPAINDLKNLTITYGTILIQSILFKIFSYYGLIINEFLAIFLFILVFYKIFNFYFSKNISLLYSLFLFSVPAIISLLELENLQYFSVLYNDIFTLRTHRPIYANIILYLFIYVIFLLENSNLFSKFLFFLLGILTGLSFTGFYYHFVVELIFIFFFLIYKLNKKLLTSIIKNLSILYFFLIGFLIISTPFFLNSFYSEPDYLVRNGLFSLTPHKKFFLLNYYFEKYTSILFVFSIIFSLFIIFFFKKKILNINLIIIPFIFFLSSFIAPVIFILFSPKSGLLYHFNNIVIICFFFFIFSCSTIFLNYIFSSINKKLIFFLILILISLNLNHTFQIQLFKFKDNKERNIRYEFSQIEKKINEIILYNKENKKNSFLTFDNDVQILLILNDIKYLNINNQTFSPKTDSMIEIDIINSFKFLGLKKNDFINFLDNKMDRWRLINYNVADFFRAKYVANSLNTYNDSLDFNDDIINFIKNTSPIYSQQLAVPNYEFVRLEKKFDSFSNAMTNFTKPDYIILKKDHFVYQRINKKVLNEFCLIFEGDFYIFYSTFNKKSFCIKSN